MVGQEAEQVQGLQDAQHLVVLAQHHQAVHTRAQQQRHGIAQRIGRAHRDHRAAGQRTHRQLVQRAPVKNSALQRGVGEDARRAPGGRAQPGDQHTGAALRLEQAHHRDDVAPGIDRVYRAQIGLVDACQHERLALMLVWPLGQHAELVPNVGKQQRAKAGVARNQLVHRFVGQLVSHYFLSGHKAAAGAPGHQAPAIKTVIGAVGGLHLVALGLCDKTLDEDEQVRGHRPPLQHHGAFGEIGNVDAGAHQALLVRAQAVKGRSGKVEGIGHGGSACRARSTLRPRHSTRQALRHACSSIPAGVEPGIALQPGA